MGQDYAQRKQAKKQRRGSADVATAKPKRNKRRRLCRGPCYQEPVLAPAEKDDEPEEAKVSMRAARQVASAAGAPVDKHSSKTRKHKQSTAVNLLQPAGAAAKELHQKAGDVASSAPLAGMPQLIQQFMGSQRLAAPTPVQERCWPVCLAGQDICASAGPGSGKTLAFLLPAACLLQRWGHGEGTKPAGPVVVVLVPTRELAQQIARVSRPLAKLFGLRSVCVVGGIEADSQAAALRTQPHLLVATPGRLLDLLEGEDSPLTLSEVKVVVLDEADKMLSLGLQPQLRRIRRLVMPANRAATGQPSATVPLMQPVKAKRPQVLLFSATMPEAMTDVASKWLRRPEHVQVEQAGATISASVVQVVHVCAEHKKLQKLQRHLEQIRASTAGQRNPKRILVFANRIKTVRVLHNALVDEGWRAAQLHGDRSQAEREAALQDFKSGKAQVLVATDVAARGLHISGLPYVVNYDFPSSLDTYVHRVGRTGRLSAEGHCFSFLTRNLAPLAADLLELLQVHQQAVDPNLIRLAEAYSTAQRMQQAGAHPPANGMADQGRASTSPAAPAPQQDGNAGSTPAADEAPPGHDGEDAAACGRASAAAGRLKAGSHKSSIAAAGAECKKTGVEGGGSRVAAGAPEAAAGQVREQDASTLTARPEAAAVKPLAGQADSAAAMADRVCYEDAVPATPAVEAALRRHEAKKPRSLLAGGGRLPRRLKRSKQG